MIDEHEQWLQEQIERWSAPNSARDAEIAANVDRLVGWSLHQFYVGRAERRLRRLLKSPRSMSRYTQRRLSRLREQLPAAIPADWVLLSMPEASEQFGYAGKSAKKNGGKWIARLIKDGELWAQRRSPKAKKWWFSRTQLAEVRRKLGR